MHPDWQSFLLSQEAYFQADGGASFPQKLASGSAKITPLTHFGIISVSGPDAFSLLQGQLTCDVREISQNQGALAAMCNAQGRVIATFVLIQREQGYWLILPLSLADKLRAKLRMYILRSKVDIENISNEIGLFGLLGEELKNSPAFSVANEQGMSMISFPASGTRTLLAGPPAESIQYWQKLSGTGQYVTTDTIDWRLSDLRAGIPWLDESTSESYIPQMLNLDKLGGISLNKGCYTGQEVVARTHYLGKVKREMMLAEWRSSKVPEPNTPVINSHGQTAGSVLAALSAQDKCELLLIMQTTDLDHNGLHLSDYNNPTSLRIVPFAS